MIDESDFKVWKENPINQIILNNLKEDIEEFRHRIIYACNFKNALDNCFELYFNKGSLTSLMNIYTVLNDFEEFKNFLENTEKEKTNE